MEYFWKKAKPTELGDTKGLGHGVYPQLVWSFLMCALVFLRLSSRCFGSGAGDAEQRGLRALPTEREIEVVGIPGRLRKRTCL